MNTFSIKKYAAVCILAGIVLTILFGFSFMDHGMAGHAPCLASVLTGDPCPVIQMQMLVHHLAAVQFFSSVVLPPVFILFFFVVLFFGIRLFLSGGSISRFQSRLFSHARNIHNVRSGTRALLRWLAFLEHSPSFS